MTCIAIAAFSLCSAGAQNTEQSQENPPLPDFLKGKNLTVPFARDAPVKESAALGEEEMPDVKNMPVVNAQNDTQPQGSQNKISLDVKNMDVIDVLKILADKGKLNLSIGGNVKGRITLFLKDIDVNDALEIALISSNLAYERKGDIIYVMTEREYELTYGRKYWEKKEMKVFNLKYARATRVKSLLSQVISKVGKVVEDEPANALVVIDTKEKILQISNIVQKIDKPIQTKIFELNYIAAADLKEKLSDMVTKDAGSLNIDEVSNKIVVTDYPKKILDIGKVIRAFDVKPLQVLINAKIIELRPSKQFFSGINWDYWLEKYFRVEGSFSLPTASGTTEKASFGTIGVADPTKKGDYTAIIDFLEIFGKTEVLSTPRILALNNQEAKISVATEDVYITSSVSEVGDSAVTTQSVNTISVGVKLYVTPTINREGYITLKVKPEISSAEREEITAEDKVTEIPVVTKSEAETTVIVRDGVSVIIGGLRKISHQKEQRRIPILGRIPGLGMFFGSKKDDWSKTELIIVLTPNIISGDKSIETEIREKHREAYYESVASGEWEESYEVNQEDMGYDNVTNGSGMSNEESNGQTFQEESALDDTAGSGMSFTGAAEAVVPDEELSGLKTGDYFYYQELIDKIKQTASRYRTINEGTVQLEFMLSRQGQLLGEPEAISLDNDGALEDVAREIIKESSPFPAFPTNKKEEQESFQVLLVF